MELKPWYPSDYRHALENILTSNEVDRILSKPDCGPRFVYGPLMLPTVLKYHIHMNQQIDISKNMTQATLHGYRICQFAGSSPPVIIRSTDPRSTVQGILIFDLNNEQRNAIYDFEAGLMDLCSVQVDIWQWDDEYTRSVRTVDGVGAFQWNSPTDGLTPLEAASWSVDRFLESAFYEHVWRSQMAVEAEEQLSASVQLGEEANPHLSSEQQLSPGRDRSRFRSSLDDIPEM
ncbi:hypothetical protein AOR_1_1128134 [Paecilomyces variotii No. 5]|uniref:Putative gamma-glutamylcyclotransferase n=1 Tax=Byssochlamys spectabilis (strain No. 5 / NBRC 109023) TaxID=1356009 RepID=V5GGA7_BYSSN|nr:hypothetical protein AOR_1_1128134 [Paecilomyces variotii No. 5]